MAMVEREIARVLQGVDKTAFPRQTQFVCAANVAAPRGFEGQWVAFPSDAQERAESWLKHASLDEISVIVLVATVDDLASPSVATLHSKLRAHTWAAPPVFLLPIATGEGSADASAVRMLLEASGVMSCIDDVLFGPLTGYSLAFAVQAKLRHVGQKIVDLSNRYEERNQAVANTKSMKASIDFTTWQYLRAKVFRSIPPLQDDIQEDSKSVAGIALRSKLSSGFFGWVYMATRQVPDRPSASQACSMLVVAKNEKRHSVGELQMLNHYLTVMEVLDQYLHPNISHLITVIHSQSRLCVCTEICGRRTIFGRLKLRDNPPEASERRLLPASAIKTMATKISSAVHHLHEVVGICHRDIKPENFTIREHEDEVLDLKLGGFELAMMTSDSRKCRSACGTMPFAAPETILSGRDGYDGMIADMWSVGVLFLELACGVRCIERRILGLPAGADTATSTTLQPRAETARQIQFLFSDYSVVERFFNDAPSHLGSTEVQSWMIPIIMGLLRVDMPERLTASVLGEAMQTLLC